METVNIHKAKTHLSRLVEQVAAGEPFIIAKAGKPMAKVVPIEAADEPVKRRRGFLTGQVQIPDDFDTMFQAEIESMFYGSE